MQASWRQENSRRGLGRGAASSPLRMTQTPPLPPTQKAQARGDRVSLVACGQARL